MTGVQKAIKIGAICLAVIIIIAIINFVLSILGFAGAFGNEVESFTKTYENIKELELDLSATNLKVIKGDTFTIDAKDVKKGTDIKENNGRLKLKEKSNWFWNFGQVGEITITIPEGVLTLLDIDAGAGTISLKDLTANNLKLDQGAGTIDIVNSTFNNTDIDGGAGEIKADNSTLNNLDLDAGVGKVTISGNIYGHSKIDCGVGEINLDLYDSLDNYYIKAEKGVGSITIDGVSYKNNTTLGHGTNTIDIDGGVGAINVKFRQKTS